jgi:hypothetical protein
MDSSFEIISMRRTFERQPRGGGSGTGKARERVETAVSNPGFSDDVSVKREASGGSEKTTSGAESASLRDSHPLFIEQESECIGQATAESGQQQADLSNAARPNGPTDTRRSRRRRNDANRLVIDSNPNVAQAEFTVQVCPHRLLVELDDSRTPRALDRDDNRLRTGPFGIADRQYDAVETGTRKGVRGVLEVR